MRALFRAFKVSTKLPLWAVIVILNLPPGDDDLLGGEEKGIENTGEDKLDVLKIPPAPAKGKL